MSAEWTGVLAQFDLIDQLMTRVEILSMKWATDFIFGPFTDFSVPVCLLYGFFETCRQTNLCGEEKLVQVEIRCMYG